MTLLQRKFVKSLEYDMLQAMAHISEENKEAIEWILISSSSIILFITQRISSILNVSNTLLINKSLACIFLYTAYLVEASEH